MVTDKYVNLPMISKKEKFIESLTFICNYLPSYVEADYYFKNTAFIDKVVDGEG